ncbi:MAG: hypothetical protein ACXWLE_11830 [Rhizomicrobium sp.]
MLRSITLALVLCAIPLGAALGADDAAFAPIRQFADGMNAGDTKKAADAYAASAPIIDEFAPYHWSNFADWNRDFATFFKRGNGSDFHMALSAPSFKGVGPANAYAVVPTTLTYKIKGKPITEKGLFTFATQKDAKGWHIASWTWSTL